VLLELPLSSGLGLAKSAHTTLMDTIIFPNLKLRNPLGIYSTIKKEEIYARVSK